MSPEKVVPVRVTSHLPVVSSKALAIAVTFGTVEVNEKPWQTAASHLASSDVFRNTDTVPALPSV